VENRRCAGFRFSISDGEGMVCVRKSETSSHNAPREPLKGETLGRRRE
jgi:hypothetical protein